MDALYCVAKYRGLVKTKAHVTRRLKPVSSIFFYQSTKWPSLRRALGQKTLPSVVFREILLQFYGLLARNR